MRSKYRNRAWVFGALFVVFSVATFVFLPIGTKRLGNGDSLSPELFISIAGLLVSTIGTGFSIWLGLRQDKYARRASKESDSK